MNQCFNFPFDLVLGMSCQIPDLASESEVLSPAGSINSEDMKLLDEQYDPVEESRRLEREGSKRSSSPPQVTEGPGASSKSSSAGTATSCHCQES